MALSKNPYKGSRDFFPALKRTQDFLFSKMRETAAAFGFEPYDGPLLEDVDLYLAKSGQELINEQIYSFKDRGDRFVAIRPEMTPTLARMVAQIHRQAFKPIKWYSIPNLWRYERPQRGRLREHWQFNCDIFGATEKDAAAEVLQVLVSLFKSYGADSRHFEVLLNSRVVVNAVFQERMKLDGEKALAVYKILDRAKKVSPEVLDEMILKLGIGSENEQILKDYLKLTSIAELNQFARANGIEAAIASFVELNELLGQMGLKDYIAFDPAIVRGLDYYTGVVFEAFDKHPDNRRALCGGGAYANLLEIFNEPALPGVGFGLGDVTLADFLASHGLLPDFGRNSVDVFLATETDKGLAACFKIAERLRAEGWSVFNGLVTPNRKKVFSGAETQGAKYVALINEQSLNEEILLLKRLNSPDDYQRIPFAEVNRIKREV